MTSTYSNAPVLTDRGVGNIIALDTHPNFSTRHTQRKAAQCAIRVFVGPRSEWYAQGWMARHGDATAMALDLSADPSLTTWPVGRILVLVPAGVRLSFRQVAAFAAAWRRDGVVYGSIPHQPAWPNLWPACCSGGVR